MGRWLTDAEYTALRQRVGALAHRPEVAAILDRAARLTGAEQAALDEAWRTNFRLYRTAQGELWHRAVKAYGQNWRDLLAVKYMAGQAERAGRGPYEGDWGAHCAAEDKVEALLIAECLQPHEVPILAGPWDQVIGPVPPLPAGTELAPQPLCPRHQSPMVVRLPGTCEQEWCGTWFDCRWVGCTHSVLLPSPELAELYAGKGV